MTTRLIPMIEDPETETSVRDVLEAGRDASVADYDFDAGLAKHLAVIQAGLPMPDWAKGLEGSGTGGGAATAAGAGATALGGVAWLVVPVVTAAVVAAAMWAREPAPAAPAPAVGVHAVQPSTASATPASAAQPVPVVQPSAPSEPETVLPAAESERVVSPASRSRAGRTSASASKSRIASPSTQTAPASSGSDLFVRARPVAGNAQSSRAPSEQPSEQPLREAPARETAREAEASRDAQPAPVAKLDDARLEREMGMLAVAQRVLTADPSRALSLVRQSAREFGDSMFAPERGQLELLALVKLGRLDEAKRLARPYLARYPNGPFSDRVRRALASAAR
jgi:hypothetical protein